MLEKTEKDSFFSCPPISLALLYILWNEEIQIWVFSYWQRKIGIFLKKFLKGYVLGDLETPWERAAVPELTNTAGGTLPYPDWFGEKLIPYWFCTPPCQPLWDKPQNRECVCEMWAFEGTGRKVGRCRVSKQTQRPLCVFVVNLLQSIL